ncbi:hypothetical protein B0H12DRAFT_1129022 [Mycena haematopus]|nr:hypothetical protein B0H12DRAFT_1129022 [Mycena haematopus]
MAIRAEIIELYVIEHIDLFWQFVTSLSPRITGSPVRRQACSEPNSNDDFDREIAFWHGTCAKQLASMLCPPVSVNGESRGQGAWRWLGCDVSGETPSQGRRKWSRRAVRPRNAPKVKYGTLRAVFASVRNISHRHNRQPPRITITTQDNRHCVPAEESMVLHEQPMVAPHEIHIPTIRNSTEG